MTYPVKIEMLKNIIYDMLAPRIATDYWLLEVPYYDNIGDTLIWQGEMDFLKAIPHKCKGMHSLETFRFPKIPESDMILFQGGGNFGDLWPKHHNFKMEVVKRYPKNKFLFFPQTVYFESDANLKACAAFLADYDVTICARDRVSYETLKQHFSNTILLVPDMAFCLEINRWTRGTFTPTAPLILKRGDKEFKPSPALERCIAENPSATVADWPTMGVTNRIEYFRGKTHALALRLRLPRIYDGYMRWIYRPYLVRSGVRFLLSHTDVYTTRLHTCILAVLLGKTKVAFFDNSYGKNKQFYETWLLACDSVTLVE